MKDMTLLRRLLRPGVEIAIAIVFFVLWMIGEAGRSGGMLATAPDTRWIGILVWIVPFALIAIAIASSRIAVWIAHGAIALMLILALCSSAFMLGSTSWPAYLGVVIAVGFMANSPDRRQRWATLVLAVTYGIVIDVLMVLRYYPDSSFISWASVAGLPPSDIPLSIQLQQGQQLATNVAVGLGVVFVLVLTFAWLVGFSTRAVLDRFGAVRAQTETRGRLRESDARLGLAEERGRIARDLHDILAHSLTVVVAQSEGLHSTRSRTTEETDHGLTIIASAARAALGDIRLVVEGLRSGEGEVGDPSVAELDELLTELRAQGITIERSDFGDVVALRTGARIAVYRIVQEALTNALAHGGVGSAVRLSLDWRGPGLAVTIVSAVGHGAVERGGPGGQGIIGMQERATIVGGWLTAGADEDGFRVTAFIPYQADDVAGQAAA